MRPRQPHKFGIRRSEFGFTARRQAAISISRFSIFGCRPSSKAWGGAYGDYELSTHEREFHFISPYL